MSLDQICTSITEIATHDRYKNNGDNLDYIFFKFMKRLCYYTHTKKVKMATFFCIIRSLFITDHSLTTGLSQLSMYLTSMCFPCNTPKTRMPNENNGDSLFCKNYVHRIQISFIFETSTPELYTWHLRCSSCKSDFEFVVLWIIGKTTTMEL